jgi:hypothetical protein
MSVDLTNAEDSIPLHLSALIGNLAATKALCKRGAPLMSVPVSARQRKTSVLPYLALKRSGLAPFLLALFKGAPL